MDVLKLLCIKHWNRALVPKEFNTVIFFHKIYQHHFWGSFSEFSRTAFQEGSFLFNS